MVFDICGDRTLPPIMLIHGMATTAQACFDRVYPLLNDYCVILCEVDGHTDKEDSIFISLNDCCEKIERFVSENFAGKLYGLLGFSMGGSISVTLISRGNISIQKVILDAAFCVKMGALAPLYTGTFCWAIKRIQKNRKLPVFLVESIMGKGNYAIIDSFYKNIKIQTVKNVCHDVYRFDISPELAKFKGNVVFWYGSNEKYPKKTAALLRKHLANMQTYVISGMGHGQFMNERPEEYAEKISDFMK